MRSTPQAFIRVTDIDEPSVNDSTSLAAPFLIRGSVAITHPSAIDAVLVNRPNLNGVAASALVGQQDVGKHRPRLERELSALLVVHVETGDIGRQEVV